MTDIRISMSAANFLGDIGIVDNDIATDDGLETAVVISLFTDARAPDGTLGDDEGEDPRGFWGDDTYGSLFWTLKREKQIDKVLNRAKQYGADALKWMVDDKVAKSVIVLAEIASEGVLALSIKIQRPKGSDIEYRFNYAWQQQSSTGV
jgi:phage gp46-like protein